MAALLTLSAAPRCVSVLRSRVVPHTSDGQAKPASVRRALLDRGPANGGSVRTSPIGDGPGGPRGPDDAGPRPREAGTSLVTPPGVPAKVDDRDAGSSTERLDAAIVVAPPSEEAGAPIAAGAPQEAGTPDKDAGPTTTAPDTGTPPLPDAGSPPSRCTPMGSWVVDYTETGGDCRLGDYQWLVAFHGKLTDILVGEAHCAQGVDLTPDGCSMTYTLSCPAKGDTAPYEETSTLRMVAPDRMVGDVNQLFHHSDGDCTTLGTNSLRLVP